MKPKATDFASGVFHVDEYSAQLAQGGIQELPCVPATSSGASEYVLQIILLDPPEVSA